VALRRDAGFTEERPAMLVLSRRRDQAIMIGHDVEITVVDIRGDKVRVGIRAPATVSVHRREVYDAIQDANVEASKLQPGDLNSKPEIAAPPNAPRPDPSKQSSADPFLLAAMDEAKKGLAEGGLPIGSVLVRGNQIIGRGHNRRVQKGDPMAHAEIDCLTNAGRQKTYKNTVLYSTLMPCYLCSGAAVQFGIPKVIVGESVNFSGDCKGESGSPCRGVSSLAFMRSHGIEVIDLHDEPCIEMISRFIREHPGLWLEDIGRNDE
jgi:creatinine deaminase